MKSSVWVSPVRCLTQHWALQEGRRQTWNFHTDPKSCSACPERALIDSARGQGAAPSSRDGSGGPQLLAAQCHLPSSTSLSCPSSIVPHSDKPGHVYRYLLQKCCEWELQFSLFGFPILMLEVHPGCFSRAPEQEKGVTPPLASKQTSALRRSPGSTFHSWIPYYAIEALRRDGRNKESICWSSSCTLFCSLKCQWSDLKSYSVALQQ